MNITTFWVNVDTTRVTIHRSTCQSMGTRQKNPTNGRWSEHSSYQEALKSAKEGRSRIPHNCANCRPDL